ncbi:hypothetical protein ABEW34_04680 [Paenibacillus algorifonticola]|uniref:hypothetical protein n=1 Tax=Paenibacillus algorifonticola TaxID=684063 RepID=UPI003D2BD55F
MNNNVLQQLARQSRLVKGLIILALLCTAILFAYQAEDLPELKSPSDQLTIAAGDHHGVAIRYQSGILKQLFQMTLIGITIVLGMLVCRKQRLIPLSIRRAFIPQQIKDLFLMPVKFTGSFI